MQPRFPTQAAQPTAIALAILSLASTLSPALAQSADSSQRIEVTGSIIRRSIVDEAALPVTSVSATEMNARLNTELKDFMLELPTTAAAAIGGLGIERERDGNFPGKPGLKEVCDDSGICSTTAG